MTTVWEDVRYAFRLLLRQPVFTLTVLVALALGIGANSAIFSVVNSVLLRPLPYAEPGQLYFVWARNLEQQRPQASLSAHDLLDLQKPTSSFSSVTGTFNYSATQTGEGEPLRIMLTMVSPNYFQTLGVRPMIGRGFEPQEATIGNNNVVVLTHGFWKRRYAGDPAVVGKTTMLDGELHMIVGVLPDLAGDYRTNDLYIPLAFGAAELGARNARYLSAIVRLKPGVAPRQAELELASLAGQFAADRPQANRGYSYYLVPAQDEVTGASKQALLVLAAAVGIVLLITCANLASLLLVRAAGRQKEVAVRTAMGANRGRIIRQLLTESLVISATGGMLGLAVAYGAIRAIQLYGPAAMPRLQQASIDASVLLFTFFVALAAGLLFGSAPALHTLHINLSTVLREESRGTSGGVAKSRARSTLVIFEVALAAVLLVAAGLLVRSIWGLNRIDPGFKVEGVLTLRTTLPEVRYATPESQVNYVRQALSRIESVPGVSSAAVTTALPLMGVNWMADIEVEGRTRPEGGSREQVTYNAVSPRYFETLNIPVQQGRAFEARDAAESSKVLIVSESFARQYLPGVNPIGKFIRMKVSRFEASGEVVGVVGDVRYLKLDEPPRPTLYQPHAQLPWPFLAFAVRTAADPAAMAPAVRRAFLEVDPEQPVDRVMAMERLVDAVVSQQRLAMSMLLIFAGLAVLLAGLGLYGLLAYTVAQRGREIGIRMALGASEANVMILVVRQGMMLTVFGVVAGLLVSPLASAAMKGLLYGVKPWDPATFSIVGGLLLLISLVAGLLPSWRAIRVDPATSLRSE